MTLKDNIISILQHRGLPLNWLVEELGWKKTKMPALLRNDSTYLSTIVDLARALNVNLADVAVENKMRSPNHAVFNCTTYGGIIMAAAGYKYQWYSDLARRVGTSRQNIHSQLTRGNISLKTLEKIASGIGLTLEELLQWPEK